MIFDVVRSRRSKVKEQYLTRGGAHGEIESILVAKSGDLGYKVHVAGGERLNLMDKINNW